MKFAYRLLGFASLFAGAVGVLVPLVPTVPFLILAAFGFARSDPRIEAWLVVHPRFGPPIEAWRTRGAISPHGKRAAYLAFAVSAVLGFVLLSFPWSAVPLLVGVVGGAWIASRPSH